MHRSQECMSWCLALMLALASQPAWGLANQYCSSWFSQTTGGSSSSACPPCAALEDVCKPVDAYWENEQLCLLPVGYAGSILPCGSPLSVRLVAGSNTAGLVTIFQTSSSTLYVTFQVYCPYVMRALYSGRPGANFTAGMRVWTDTVTNPSGGGLQYTDMFVEEGTYTCLTYFVDLAAVCNPHTSRFSFDPSAAANGYCACQAGTANCPPQNLASAATLFIQPQVFVSATGSTCQDVGVNINSSTPFSPGGLPVPVQLLADVPGGGGVVPWAPQQCRSPSPPTAPNFPGPIPLAPPSTPTAPPPAPLAPPGSIYSSGYMPTEAGQVAPPTSGTAELPPPPTFSQPKASPPPTKAATSPSPTPLSSPASTALTPPFPPSSSPQSPPSPAPTSVSTPRSPAPTSPASVFSSHITSPVTSSPSAISTAAVAGLVAMGIVLAAAFAVLAVWVVRRERRDCDKALMDSVTNHEGFAQPTYPLPTHPAGGKGKVKGAVQAGHSAEATVTIVSARAYSDSQQDSNSSAPDSSSGSGVLEHQRSSSLSHQPDSEGSFEADARHAAAPAPRRHERSPYYSPGAARTYSKPDPSRGAEQFAAMQQMQLQQLQLQQGQQVGWFGYPGAHNVMPYPQAPWHQGHEGAAYMQHRPQFSSPLSPEYAPYFAPLQQPQPALRPLQPESTYLPPTPQGQLQNRPPSLPLPQPAQLPPEQPMLHSPLYAQGTEPPPLNPFLPTALSMRASHADSSLIPSWCLAARAALDDTPTPPSIAAHGSGGSGGSGGRPSGHQEPSSEITPALLQHQAALQGAAHEGGGESRQQADGFSEHAVPALAPTASAPNPFMGLMLNGFSSGMVDSLELCAKPEPRRARGNRDPSGPSPVGQQHAATVLRHPHPHPALTPGGGSLRAPALDQLTGGSVHASARHPQALAPASSGEASNGGLREVAGNGSAVQPHAASSHSVASLSLGGRLPQSIGGSLPHSISLAWSGTQGEALSLPHSISLAQSAGGAATLPLGDTSLPVQAASLPLPSLPHSGGGAASLPLSCSLAQSAGGAACLPLPTSLVTSGSLAHRLSLVQSNSIDGVGLNPYSLELGQLLLGRYKVDAKPIRSRNGFVVPCLDIQKPGSASVVLRLVNNPSHWNKLRKLLKKMQSSCAPILVAAVEPGVADTMWPSWGMLVCQSGLHILAALMATLAEPVTQAQVVSHVLEALAELHAAGWVHGNVQPSNVMWFDDDGRFKLLALGGAELADSKKAKATGGALLDCRAAGRLAHSMFLGCLPEAPEAAQLMADQPPQVPALLSCLLAEGLTPKAASPEVAKTILAQAMQHLAQLPSIYGGNRRSTSDAL